MVLKVVFGTFRPITKSHQKRVMYEAGNSQGRREACGGGRQRPVPEHRQASRFNRHPQMSLTPDHPESTHCQERFRNPTVFTQQEPKAPDGHRSNSPERATRRLTSPSVHAYPTPYRCQTLSRPALHTPSRTPRGHRRCAASSTRPTDAAHPRRQAPNPPRPRLPSGP